MRYCPNCGCAHEAPASFCQSCGQRMPQDPGAAPASAQTPPPYNAPAQPHGTPPDTHLAKAIITTILCCLPFGIVAIVYASSVNGKFMTGDVAGAQEASRQADKWGNWSIWAGVAFGVLYGVAMLIAAVADK